MENIKDKHAKIPVVSSPSHVHLTADLIQELFCDDYRLHPDAPLTQANQFKAKESVTLVGPLQHLRDVPIIGPPREINQIEISPSDAKRLGVEPPVRRSGDLRDTPGITIVGPRTAVVLGSGVICTGRHLHMNPAEAAMLGVRDQESVCVAIVGSQRERQFNDVLVRVSPDYNLELHLDEDEAHAAGLEPGDYAVVRRREA